MKYPIIDNIASSRQMTTYFAGLNATVQCQEGEFYDMKNITTQYYPTLAPRNARGICKTFTNIQGILDKESLIWIDNGTLYIDNTAKSLSGVTLSPGKKTMYKMAAYLIIMPDKIWYNTDDNTCGYLDATKTINTGTSISFTLCNGDGTAITWHDSSYYDSHDPADGDYMMSTTDGKTSLKVYSKTTSIWSTVTTTYMKISSSGIGAAFEKEDGIKITIDNSSAHWDYAEKIFVNEEDNGKLSLNTWISDKGNDYITVIALLKENKTFTNLPMTVERKMPDIAHMTECQNRLWGCSTDGHEIYCCKLGDPKNWNYFAGLSIDSYAATVGSDGLFTGAVTYNNYPIFFKEDTWLKVTVSATGAHSYREQQERGLQSGSEKSICLINGVLYYKGVSCVYAFDGSSPSKVSDGLGEHRYSSAVGGTIDGRYYLSMVGEDGVRKLYTYDTASGFWAIEDSLAIDQMCKHDAELYLLAGNTLYSVDNTYAYGTHTTENAVEWYAQSGEIGYALPDNKYIRRINLRISLEFGAYADFYMRYDDDEKWIHHFNMSGKGTRSFVIPVTPRRCDHFSYLIKGKGKCKIYSITKEVEEGSDGV